MRPEVRLREALIETLHDTELALAAMAAWALGCMGDSAMGCKEMAPLIRMRMIDEPDKGLQMAYASALGSLRDPEGTDGLLTLPALPFRVEAKFVSEP